MGRLVDDYPELVAKWDYKKNTGLSPDDFTSRSHKKVGWICPVCGYSWEAVITDRSAGHGCPRCGGTMRKTHAEFVAELAEKNPTLEAIGTYKNNRTKIFVRCKTCGYEWGAVPTSLTDKGSGCPVCSGKKVIAGRNDLATLNPELSCEWDYDKNGTLTPQDVAPGSHKKVGWKCSVCGYPWEASIYSRSAGNGCPACAGKIVIPGRNDLATIHPELAAEWDYEKNGDLTPQTISYSSHKKVGWICSICGHKWEATVNSRSTGNGCSECSSESHTSFPEQAILYYLGLVTPVENRAKVNDKYEVDILLPNLSIGIEYDGLRWHEGAEAAKKEKLKDDCLEQVGIRILRIKEIPRKEPLPARTNNIIYCHYTPNYSYLNDVIHDLFVLLCLPDIDIDLIRDKALIWDQYIKAIKKNRLAAIDPKLAAQWHSTKNGDLTPEQVVPASNKKVWWRCNVCGHEWQAIINDRSRGRGCPQCGRKQASVTRYKQVRCIETGEIFASCKAAAQWAHCDPSNISCCCHGKQRVGGGYHWEFV